MRRHGRVKKVFQTLFDGLGRVGKLSEPRAWEEARILQEEAELASKQSGQAVDALLGEWLRRRVEKDEPINYIIGKAWFWTLELQVNNSVLIPRPCSETLVEVASNQLSNRVSPTVLDICTGPGTLLLATLEEVRSATGFGCDISAQALELAKQNAKTNRLEDRVHFFHANLHEPIAPSLPKEAGLIDLILCNPPYLTKEDMEMVEPSVRLHEPALALFGGNDGLDCYKGVADRVQELSEGGLIAGDAKVVVEAGMGQAEQICDIFLSKAVVKDCSITKDLRGVDRCLMFTLSF